LSVISTPQVMGINNVDFDKTDEAHSLSSLVLLKMETANYLRIHLMANYNGTVQQSFKNTEKPMNR
jgi:hypothetical protein